MKPCKDCRALWPFAFAISLSALLSFPAWATLELVSGDALTQTVGTVAFFSLCAAALVLYVRWCMRRNCAGRDESAAQLR